MPRNRSMTQNRSTRGSSEKRGENDEEMKPLVPESPGVRSRSSSRDVPLGDDKPFTDDDKPITFLSQAIASNPELFKQSTKFAACFCGLQASYLTWGYMQELIMTTRFNATERVPNGHFPSAAFCVFSNRFLAVIVAAVAVRIKHGSVFQNNVAPIWAFTPCALSNTMSSWSQYASLKVRRVRREYEMVTYYRIHTSHLNIGSLVCLVPSANSVQVEQDNSCHADGTATQRNYLSFLSIHGSFTYHRWSGSFFSCKQKSHHQP